MNARIERVATVLAAADAEARAMGLPDGFMRMAQALDDAGLLAMGRTAVPGLRAEIARQRKIINRLTDGAGDGVRRVRMYETESGGWRVRWLLDGSRKVASCSSETEAKDLVSRLEAEGGVE